MNLKLCYARFKFVNHPVNSLLALRVSAPLCTPSYSTFPSAVPEQFRGSLLTFIQLIKLVFNSGAESISCGTGVLING